MCHTRDSSFEMRLTVDGDGRMSLAFAEDIYVMKRDAYGAFIEETSKLKAENRRLKELLRDLEICTCGKYCYGCPHQYDGCDRDRRIREMGIAD